MLSRILEPELMDTAEDAREYDSMDHAAVNGCFVTDFLQALGDHANQNITVLDVGTGTALIPIEICRRAPSIRVVAVDAATHMLDLARKNIDAACLGDRIHLVHADVKNLPFDSFTFDAVVSNSILHHIAAPRSIINEVLILVAPQGIHFHRDLCRPASQLEVDWLVKRYAGDSTPYQQKLFHDSLRAALTLEEIRSLVPQFSSGDSVEMTSDRHWTWCLRQGT